MTSLSHSSMSVSHISSSSPHSHFNFHFHSVFLCSLFLQISAIPRVLAFVSASMGRFPTSESSSGSPSMGGFPPSEASSGSPSLGSFPPSEASSGSPSMGRFPHFEAGSSRHQSPASRTQHCSAARPFPCTPAGPSQHCSPDVSSQNRSLTMLPPKPPRSMRSPRPFTSRMERDCSTDIHQDRKMGCSSTEESLPAEKQPNSSLKIIIRWSGKQPAASDNAAEEKAGGEEPKPEEGKVKEEKVEDQAEKKWNLRPRKPIGKGGAGAVQEPQLQEGSSSQKAPKKKPAEKKKKPMKLSIALSRREIEEDLFAMTGSRPSRKPKRRPKQVQNIVNVRQSASITGYVFDSSLLVIV